jgi:SAM-dependent methyltransferase
MFRLFIRANSFLARRVDQGVFPKELTTDGKTDFQRDFVWKHFHSGSLVYDVGGGKQPFLPVAQKQLLRCSVVGLDVSEVELSRAPEGAYDETIAADVMMYRGRGDADVVICQTLLEHVRDAGMAMSGIASLLKPSGVCLLFVPCRNSAFARLNLALPENVKRKILFAIYPQAERLQGFPSYYNRCTPKGVVQLAARSGLTVLDTRHYYMSDYFSFFFPAHALWRLWTAAVFAFGATELCESFAVALEKS